MFVPVVLSGGAGARLWPVSREAHPKPFIVLPDGQSLLQKTYRRADGLPDVTTTLTVTNRDYYFRTKDEYQACWLPVVPRFLLEPCSCNTAPAITLAAIAAEWEWGSDVTLLTLLADHVIADQDAFAVAVAHARTLAAAGQLVTFGIKPTSPETGYGCIEAGDPQVPQECKVRRFVEKPDSIKAASYTAQGNFSWNSGIFCFQAGARLATIAVTAPEVLQAARRCWDAPLAGNPTIATPIDFDPASFAAHPAISIDYAVMEKAANVAVVPCELGWSDIGSWNALGAMIATDGDGNRVLGEAELVNTHKTFILVVSGMAKVTNGEREIYVTTNETAYIPTSHLHHLENPGLLDLVVIEVQSGEYLDEDDIVRFEDAYCRAPSVAG